MKFVDFGLLLYVMVAVVISDPYEYVPADRGEFPVKNKTTILPQSFLREYDPVTVFYERKKRVKPGPEDHGRQYMKITPNHAGEYIWIDEKTLEFRPAVPWPPVTHFEVEADGVKKKLATILTPPKSISPSGGKTGLGLVKEVTLEFDYMVDPQILKKLVTFESTPLPGIDRSHSTIYTSADYRIKKGPQKSSGETSYTFIFKNPFSLGHKIRTIVKLSDIEEFNEGKRIYFFETKADFLLMLAGTYSNMLSIGKSGTHYSVSNALQIDDRGRIVLQFSSQPKELTLSEAKSLFNFSPAPRSFSFSQSGNRITATVNLEPERVYKVTIQPVPIRDESDRKLSTDGPSSFYCYRNPEKKYIRWTESYNILERYGPQHIPLHIANVNSFDLRIYRIDPLNKVFWPFPNSAVVVNEGNRPPGPGEEPLQEKEITNPLSASELKEHIQMLGSPHYSSVIDANADGITRHQTLDLKSRLQEISGKDQPGTYLVGFRELSGKSNRSYVKVQVTDLCVSTVESKKEILFAVTSYKTGKPVAGATIALEGIKKKDFKRLYSGKTDQKGLCKIPGGILYDENKTNSKIRRVIISKDSDHLVLETKANSSPPAFVNNHWTESQGEWLNSVNDKPYRFEKDRVWKGFLFPERPVYRPEEKIYLKGFVRSLFQGKYSFPKHDTVQLVISGPGNSWNVPLTLSRHGSFDYIFSEDKPATGNYTVHLKYDPPGENVYEKTLAEARFKIDAYRVPRFEVHLNGPDQIPNDKPFSVGLTASYYAGGRVIDRPVRWRVMTFPYSWSLNGWDDYFLSSDSRYSRSLRTSDRNTIDEENRTDEKGSTQLTIKPDVALGANPTRYVIEATVTDVDEQTVTDSRSVIALPSFILALKTDRYIPHDSTIKASLAAVDINEKALSGQKVTVTLKKKTWHHYLQETDFAKSEPKYITEENITDIEQREIVTDSVPVNITFKDCDPGVYIIDLSSKDKQGRIQTLQVDLFIGGDKSVVWKKSEQKIFKTVTDKDSYVPGDRAEIMLQSPYQNALALAVVEMPDGSPGYEWITVKDGQAAFTLNITEEMVNRIPVSFLLMRPRVSQAIKMPEGYFVDVGKPKTDANTTWLTVRPSANRVNISLKHEKVFTPGDTMKIAVSLSDWKGKPVEGEVTLWLVDEAVLSLGQEMDLDPVQSFLPSVSSCILMRDSRNMARGMICNFESPGGGEGLEELLDEMPVQITVRKNFKTVPYYNPSLKINKSGKKTVSIPLPENLTRFAIRAVAISGVKKFGMQKSHVSLRLPVIVQPSLPRFVRTGDRFKAGGIARIVEGDKGQGSFLINADGLTILSDHKQDTWHKFTFPGKKAKTLFAEMEVNSPGYGEDCKPKRDSIRFQMAVKKADENKGDAFAVSIPLLPDRNPVTREYEGLVTKDSVFSFDKIDLRLRPHTLSRQLLFYSDLPLLKILAGLRYLMEYPYGNTEQKISRAYPSLVYQDLWKQTGIENLDPKLDTYINNTLSYLSRCQDEDGLLSYWPGKNGTVHLTASAVEFMSDVKKFNSDNRYEFPSKVYESAIDALERSLRSDYNNLIDEYKYYERCAAAYALVKAGRIDMSYFKQLAYQTEGADALSQARIYSAIVESGKSMDKTVSDLEKKLWEHTVFKLDKNQEVFAGLQNGSCVIGAEIHSSEITGLAGLVGALSLKNSDPKKVDMMADALIRAGGESGWGNTRNNCLVMIALRNRIMAAKRQNRKAVLNLSVEGKKEGITFKENDGFYKFSFDSQDSGTVNFSSPESIDSIYVKLFERYLPEASGSEVDASQEGFVVKRQIIFPSQSEAPSKKVWIDTSGKSFEIEAGSIIEEHVQVTNPSTSHFVAVVIPLAAGFEYLNPELQTASDEFTPEGKTRDPGTYQEFYDDKLVFYFNRMDNGTFDFYFRVRATTEGTFTQPPAFAEKMYRQETRGNSPGAKIVVTPEK